jgi:type I restriction enzyme S subunit
MSDRWVLHKFKDVAVARKGKLPKEKNAIGEGLPYLTAGYLRTGRPDFWVKDLEGALIADEGDCLILWDGAGAGDLFRSRRGVVSSTMARVISHKEDITRDFLTLLISSKASYIKETCRGTTVPHVSPDAIEDMELHIPSIEEQGKIVALVHILDNFVEASGQLLENGQMARNALAESLLTNLEDEWQEVLLGDVLDISRGGSPRPIQDYLTNSDDGVNWVKISDATKSQKYIYSTELRIRREGVSKSREVFSGDFILSNSMSFGRPYIMRTNGCIHDGWLLLSNVEAHFNEDFLYNILNVNYVQRQFESLAAGSGVRNLNIEVVKKVRVRMPSIRVQSEIVSVLNVFDSYLSATKAQNLEARKFRSSLVSELLSPNSETPSSLDIEVGVQI